MADAKLVCMQARVCYFRVGGNELRCAGEGTEAFCSGGDQGVRGEGGYVGPDKIPRLNVLDLQVDYFGLHSVTFAWCRYALCGRVMIPNLSC